MVYNQPKFCRSSGPSLQSFYSFSSRRKPTLWEDKNEREEQSLSRHFPHGEPSVERVLLICFFLFFCLARSKLTHVCFQILESRERSEPASGENADGAIIVSHLVR